MSVIGAIAGPLVVRRGLITIERWLAGQLARLERDEKWLRRGLKEKVLRSVQWCNAWWSNCSRYVNYATESHGRRLLRLNGNRKCGLANTHHKDDERQRKEDDKQVQMSCVDEQILLENVEPAAKRGEQGVQDLSVGHGWWELDGADLNTFHSTLFQFILIDFPLCTTFFQCNSATKKFSSEFSLSLLLIPLFPRSLALPHRSSIRGTSINRINVTERRF